MKNTQIYFKDNPRILCPNCKERTFRKKGFDRNGNERIYTQCMSCTLEYFRKHIK